MEQEQITPTPIDEAEVDAMSECDVSCETSIHKNSENTPNKQENVVEFLEQILEYVMRMNFVDVSGLPEGTKLKRNHYSIMVTEEFISDIRQQTLDICVEDGKPYMFNGGYWEGLDADILISLLGRYAERLGVNRFDARHHLFRQELFYQLQATALPPRATEDSTETKINLLNGTYVVTEDGAELRNAKPSDFCKYQLPFSYDAAAICPMFDAYINKVLPDEATRNLLAEYIAYILTRKLKLEKILILFGSGANGKSVLFDIICALLGMANVCCYSLESLTKEDAYQRAELKDKLLNYASEINGKIGTASFKALASGEPVSARHPYGRPFTMEQYAKLMFNCNELPREVEHTDGFMRRFIIIPFSVTIPKEERDVNLAKKIISTELSGVFNWVLQGLDRLLRNGGFTESALVEQQIEDFQTESDSVAMFLEEYGYQPSTTQFKIRKEVYQEYCRFTSDFNYRAVKDKHFRERMLKRGYQFDRQSYGIRVWIETAPIESESDAEIPTLPF